MSENFNIFIGVLMGIASIFIFYPIIWLLCEYPWLLIPAYVGFYLLHKNIGVPHETSLNIKKLLNQKTKKRI